MRVRAISARASVQVQGGRSIARSRRIVRGGAALAEADGGAEYRILAHANAAVRARGRPGAARRRPARRCGQRRGDPAACAAAAHLLGVAQVEGEAAVLRGVGAARSGGASAPRGSRADAAAIGVLRADGDAARHGRDCRRRPARRVPRPASASAARRPRVRRTAARTSARSGARFSTVRRRQFARGRAIAPVLHQVEKAAHRLLGRGEHRNPGAASTRRCAAAVVSPMTQPAGARAPWWPTRGDRVDGGLVGRRRRAHAPPARRPPRARAASSDAALGEFFRRIDVGIDEVDRHGDGAGAGAGQGGGDSFVAASSASCRPSRRAASAASWAGPMALPMIASASPRAGRLRVSVSAAASRSSSAGTLSTPQRRRAATKVASASPVGSMQQAAGPSATIGRSRAAARAVERNARRSLMRRTSSRMAPVPGSRDSQSSTMPKPISSLPPMPTMWLKPTPFGSAQSSTARHSAADCETSATFPARGRTCAREAFSPMAGTAMPNEPGPSEPHAGLQARAPRSPPPMPVTMAALGAALAERSDQGGQFGGIGADHREVGRDRQGGDIGIGEHAGHRAHALCHGQHSALEAAGQQVAHHLRARRGLRADDGDRAGAEQAFGVEPTRVRGAGAFLHRTKELQGVCARGDYER